MVGVISPSFWGNWSRMDGTVVKRMGLGARLAQVGTLASSCL